MESFHFRAKEIRKHGRLQSCGIGIDQEEKRIVRKELCTELYQRMDCFFDLPDFAFRTSSVRWRVHDNGIIMITASDLAFYEFDAVTTSQRIGASFRPLATAFSFAHVTMPFEAST